MSTIKNFLPRGTQCIINFHGKEKQAMYYGVGSSTGVEESHCFVLARKSKRPDGTSSKYLFTSNPSEVFIKEVK